MRSSERTKCISEFGELWYVKPPPPLFFLFLCCHLLLLFTPLFNKDPPKVQVSAVCKTNLLFFQISAQLLGSSEQLHCQICMKMSRFV